MTRIVAGNMSLSLDGRTHGRDGEHDMGWIVPHAVTDTGRDFLTRLTDTVTTVLLGRKNYEGFGGFWPTVAQDDNAEPRDRAFAQWLDSVDKVLFSTTRTDAPWKNSRLAHADPVSEVRTLREQPGGDILAMSSRSVISTLLAADELDRLYLTLCPELVGGGARLFEDGLPVTSWSLTDLSTSDSGALSLVYDRRR